MIDYRYALLCVISLCQRWSRHCCDVGSDEELSALKNAYRASKGDMQKMIDSVMCATTDDEERFREILLPLIESKELPSYKQFTNESKLSKQKRKTKVNSAAASRPLPLDRCL